MFELHAGSNHHAKESASPWMADAKMPVTRILSQNLKTDVCIVGGGIAGLTAAYFLAREGLKVCLLEDSELGEGQTGRSTAQLSWLLDKRYAALEKIHGLEAIKLVAEGQREALRLVQDIVTAENIDCDFRRVDGFLFAGSPFQGELDSLQHEYDSVQRAGLSEVSRVAMVPLPFFAAPALKFPGQIRLHPLKYLSGLASAVQRLKGEIFTYAHVSEIRNEGPRLAVETGYGNVVDCQHVVVATNSPISNLFTLHTKQYPYRTYVLGVTVPRGYVPEGLYWDMDDPYHYIRLIDSPHSRDEEILLVGGQDHKTGQDPFPQSNYQDLLDWTRERFPKMRQVLYQWSGQVLQSIDGLPYLGRNASGPENVFVITGDSGNGTTTCTLGARLVSDLILGRGNPWEKIYEPARVRWRTLPTYIKESSNMAAQYLHWLGPQQAPDVVQIPPGEGAVISEGFRKIAVYKNEKGKIHCVSAKCTHLGGLVQWNSAEKSWDCPCHGARYDPLGHVIEGPATEDLPLMEETAENPAISSVSIE